MWGSMGIFRTLKSRLKQFEAGMQSVRQGSRLTVWRQFGQSGIGATVRKCEKSMEQCEKMTNRLGTCGAV